MRPAVWVTEGWVYSAWLARVTKMNQEILQFGKYQLVEILGEGGMARVYRAVRAGPMGFRKEVALKQILPHVAREEKLVRALINEARLGGHLRHRNVVEVYEFDQVDDVFYIAMEFVHGHTLEEVIQRAPEPGCLPPRIALQIALQICAGLEYAHSARDEDGRPMALVHRDLKPGNVMLERDGVVKIMDFGIARAETNLFKTSTAAVTKGTPIYMSPEQVEGKPLDRRSDLFSLASVVAQMVTGETAFQGTQLYHVLRQVARADVAQILAQVEPRIPALVPVLERGFQRDPEDRHGSAAEMGRALTAVYDELDGDEMLGPWLVEQFPASEGGRARGPAVGTGSPTEGDPRAGEIGSPGTTLLPSPRPSANTGGATAPMTTPAATGAPVPPPPPVAITGEPPPHPPKSRAGLWILVGSLITLLAVCFAVIAGLLLADQRGGRSIAPVQLADAGVLEADEDALADLGPEADDGEGALQEQPRPADPPEEPNDDTAVVSPEEGEPPEVEPDTDEDGEPAKPVEDDEAAEVDDPIVDDPDDGDGIVEADGEGETLVRERDPRSRPLLPRPGSFRGRHVEVDGEIPARIANGLAADGTDRRIRAAEDLEDHRTAAASEMIETLVKSEGEAKVRRQALEAGRKRRTAADVRIAAWALGHDPDPTLRVQAAHLLEAYGDPASMRPLCKALMDDSSAEVREAAAEAIEKIGDESCLPTLEYQLEIETDGDVREAIEDAIDEVGD